MHLFKMVTCTDMFYYNHSNQTYIHLSVTICKVCIEWLIQLFEIELPEKSKLGNKWERQKQDGTNK